MTHSNKHSVRLVMRMGIAAMALALVAFLAPQANSTYAAGGGNRSGLKNFQHVFVIMMENTSYTSLIGNPNAPWINFAAANYGLATSYFGVAHPSQPNYIAATSGSTQGVNSDNNVTLNVPNIVDQLEANGKTWRAYMQSLSLCNGNLLASSCGNQLYERKHDPFVSYADVQNNPARMANIVDFSQFSTDLATQNVPDFSWISPDQCNDMHGRGAPPSDPCSFSNEQLLISAGDTFLNNTVSAIMNSQAWNGNSVIIITWDETEFPFNDTSGCCDANPGGGHVITLTISHSDHSARSSNVAYNHYSMLATIEGGWNLGCLDFTCDTQNVQPMTDLVGPQG